MSLAASHVPSTANTTTTVSFVNRMELKSGTRDVKFERVVGANPVPITDASDRFRTLRQMNVILTNACNLSCSYCYEQHRKDFGRFSIQSLKKLYDFLVTCNDTQGRTFSFFGGEPLAQSSLILDFLEKYESEIAANSTNISILTVTNGLLLTPKFMDAYFKHKSVSLVISLDTDRAEIDHRELSQEQIDQVLTSIELIPTSVKERKALCMRITISPETAPTLREFVTRLHGLGVRSFVIHPLTMSLTSGYVEWDEASWVKLLNDMDLLLNLRDILIQFSEGMGIKKHSNCMLGSDMIAVDASGDYSGCYFFTNQKEALGNTILGNILENEVFVDRYTEFEVEHEKLFDDPECQSCDMQNLCYQCPAGNLVTSGKMFRPDGMCKRVVGLFLVLQETITKKGFWAKFKRLRDAYLVDPNILSYSLLSIMHTHATGVRLNPDNIRALYGELPPVGFLSGAIIDNGDLVTAVSEGRKRRTFATMKEVYEALVSGEHKPVFASNSVTAVGIDVDLLYLTLLHFFILNPKGRRLESCAGAMHYAE